MKNGYESFVDALSNGEEIGFIYKKTNFNLTSLHQKGWMLCNDDMKVQLSSFYDDVMILIDEVKIDNKILREILNALDFTCNE